MSGQKSMLPDMLVIKIHAINELRYQDHGKHFRSKI